MPDIHSHLSRPLDFHVPLSCGAAEDVTAVNGSVHAIIGPLKVPFPLANPNGCQPAGNLPCPLSAGVHYVYRSNLVIPSYAPPVRSIRSGGMVMTVDG